MITLANSLEIRCCSSESFLAWVWASQLIINEVMGRVEPELSTGRIWKLRESCLESQGQ